MDEKDLHRIRDEWERRYTAKPLPLCYCRAGEVMDRRAVTLVECLVVLAILVTLFGVIAVGRPGAKPSSDNEPPQSWNLYTAKHDGHWFVKDAGGGVCHHPDCPCRGRKAEEE